MRNQWWTLIIYRVSLHRVKEPSCSWELPVVLIF